MEDTQLDLGYISGAKEDPAQCKEPKFLAKAGWVKKAHGRVLASYKDRFIHVEKTEIVVYENEDLQNCLERFDLENYDTCLELKSTFKKKHRLIVIRSPKSPNKVHDLKFQTQTAEEKDAWIKALSDGISRAKNKVFDEVKVDDSSNLEHVTRSRPKGNRNRRPPTRIHMKEVAGVSSDGILRLDLDLDDAIMPNGTHHSTVDGTGTPKEASKAASSAGEAAEEKSLASVKEDDKPEPEASPQKKVLKPPMPPSKEAKRASAPEEEPQKDDVPEKKVLKPPMPPSKEAKPSAAPANEPTKEAKDEKTPETSPSAKKKTAVPPTPPSKPSSSNPGETSQSRPNSHPPTPPSKEKKPSHPAVESNQELPGTDDDNKEEDGKKTDDEDGDESPSADGLSEEENAASSDETKEPENEPQISPLEENPSPPLTSDNKEQDSPASDTSSGSLQTEEVIPTSDIPVVVVSLKDPIADSPSLSPLLGHLPGEKKKKKKAEEKSVDSGQHSDDDSEGSGSEDTLAASTAALRGSNTGLDVSDTSENDIQISVSLKPTKPATKGFTCWMSEPSPPIKPKTKVRSASSGNLLSDSLDRSLPSAALARSGSDEVTKLETEVALEIENTNKLLSSVSRSQAEGDNGEAMPEDLLAKAMEKLKKADHVLREVKKLKLAKDSSNRKSW